MLNMYCRFFNCLLLLLAAAPVSMEDEDMSEVRVRVRVRVRVEVKEVSQVDRVEQEQVGGIGDETERDDEVDVSTSRHFVICRFVLFSSADEGKVAKFLKSCTYFIFYSNSTCLVTLLVYVFILHPVEKNILLEFCLII